MSGFHWESKALWGRHKLRGGTEQETGGAQMFPKKREEITWGETGVKCSNVCEGGEKNRVSSTKRAPRVREVNQEWKPLASNHGNGSARLNMWNSFFTECKRWLGHHNWHTQHLPNWKLYCTLQKVQWLTSTVQHPPRLVSNRVLKLRLFDFHSNPAGMQPTGHMHVLREKFSWRILWCLNLILTVKVDLCLPPTWLFSIFTLQC